MEDTHIRMNIKICQKEKEKEDRYHRCCQEKGGESKRWGWEGERRQKRKTEAIFGNIEVKIVLTYIGRTDQQQDFSF